LLLDNKSAGWTAAGEVIGSGSRWHDVTQLHSDYHVSYADILPSRETLHSSSHSRGFVLVTAPHQPHTHTQPTHTQTHTHSRQTHIILQHCWQTRVHGTNRLDADRSESKTTTRPLMWGRKLLNGAHVKLT
jgi:hypothetical protein